MKSLPRAAYCILNYSSYAYYQFIWPEVFDLSDGGLGSRVEITPATRDLNWRLIREEVAKIARQDNFAQEP